MDWAGSGGQRRAAAAAISALRCAQSKRSIQSLSLSLCDLRSRLQSHVASDPLALPWAELWRGTIARMRPRGRGTRSRLLFLLLCTHLRESLEIREADERTRKGCYSTATTKQGNEVLECSGGENSMCRHRRQITSKPPPTASRGNPSPIA